MGPKLKVRPMVHIINLSTVNQSQPFIENSHVYNLIHRVINWLDNTPSPTAIQILTNSSTTDQHKNTASSITEPPPEHNHQQLISYSSTAETSSINSSKTTSSSPPPNTSPHNKKWKDSHNKKFFFINIIKKNLVKCFFLSPLMHPSFR